MRRAVALAAWREFVECLSWAGHEPLAEFGDRIPSWFMEEIGYSWEGPSLEWTCTTLAKTNRAALKQLGHDAPVRITYPKDFQRTGRLPRVPGRPPLLSGERRKLLAA